MANARVAIVRFSRYPDDIHVRRDAMALAAAGFSVDLICLRDSGQPARERADGITIYRLPVRHRRGGLASYMFEYVAFTVMATIAMAGLSALRRYRWIEINNLPDWLVVAGLLPRLLGTKVALYCREDTARLFASDHDLALSHPAIRLLQRIERLCIRAADRVIATQALARRDLVRQGVPREKIVVIPNCPDENIFMARVPKDLLPATPVFGQTLDTRAAPRHHRDEPFRLVTHGTLVRRYGIETLIKSMAIVCQSIPNAHLDVIGMGEYQPDLEALTRSLGLESEVTFAGWLRDYRDVAPRLQKADLGVVPIWTDFQLCNKLVDYLALGIPAVTTESSALRPYLNDDQVCFVEPRCAKSLASAIIALHDNPGRRERLGKAGRQAFQVHFAWESVKDAYLDVYRA